MNELLERISRIGLMYSSYLRDQKGELELLAELDRLNLQLSNLGVTGAGFFDALVRQGFMHDIMMVNKKPTGTESYVYALHAEDTGLTKIGFTTRLSKRISEIKNMSGAKLRLIGKSEGDKALESELHRRYESYRAHGEWFSLRDSQITELRNILSGVAND